MNGATKPKGTKFEFVWHSTWSRVKQVGTSDCNWSNVLKTTFLVGAFLENNRL